jgi:hypothetical protein
VLVIGAIAPVVARLEAKIIGHGLSIRIWNPPPALRTKLRFFRVVFQTGSALRWRLRAYDAHGKQIGTVGQGRAP